MQRILRPLLCCLITAVAAIPAYAQPEVSTYAGGLVHPNGIEVDAQGRLWVAQEGSGDVEPGVCGSDARISIITRAAQVHPFLVGLPSCTIEGFFMGAHHLRFDRDGDLLIAQAAGFAPLSTKLLAADPEGFEPGDAPLDASDVDVLADIFSFMSDQGFGVEINPYRVVLGPGGDQYIVDSAANAIIRRDRETGMLHVFATFDDLPNPTEVGPPEVDPVPTGIVFAGDRFYVSSLTGFPFVEGLARIYEVDLSGHVSVLVDGLTTVVDLTVDPYDGSLVFSHFGDFMLPDGFIENSGAIYRLRDGQVEPVVTGLNFPIGLRFDAAGTLFTSAFFDGEVLKIRLLSPAQQVELLARHVGDLVADGALRAGQGTALEAKLRAALRQINSGNLGAAGGSLGAFTNQVQAFLQAGLLAEASGQMLRYVADEIEAQLEEGDIHTAARRRGAGAARLPDGLATRYAVLQNFPNPFRLSTEIAFGLPEPAQVRLVVYDALGREVDRLVDGPLSAGAHRVVWDAHEMPSGMYFYQITAGTFTETRRMLLIR